MLSFIKLLRWSDSSHYPNIKNDSYWLAARRPIGRDGTELSTFLSVRHWLAQTYI